MVNLVDDIVTILTKNGLLGVATSVVGCVGAFLVWKYWRRHENKKIRRVLKRSLSIGILYGGQLALKRLSDYQNARADAALLEDAKRELQNLIIDDRPDFIALQRAISKLEMSGRDQDTVEILKKELQKPGIDTQSLKAYEIEMLLAEMLIYMGKCEEALAYKCLNDNRKITDGRRPLYKAIIDILQNPNSMESGKTHWEEFKEIRKDFQWPPNLLEIQDYEIPITFRDFRNVVNVLRKDIEKAKNEKEKTSPP